MQTYQLLKNIRTLLFVFISMSIIVAGIEGPLDFKSEPREFNKNLKRALKSLKSNFP